MRDYDYYLGKVIKARFGHSADTEILQECASGGIVSSILIYLLETKKIDGAFIVKSIIKDGKLDYEASIATTRAEILDCRTSVYFEMPMISKLNIIRNFKGSIAFVGLPCQIRAVKTMAKADHNLSNIKFFIGLFCGHSSNKELIRSILKKKDIEEKNIKKIIFRKGPWRGNTHIKLSNNTSISFPFKHFSTYQNLFFFAEKKCFYCSDHTSEYADISCGDVWNIKYKKEKIKISNILTRTPLGEKIIQDMISHKKILTKEVTEKDVFNAQKRSLIFHKHIKARAIIGKLFGHKILYDKHKEKARWNDYLAAIIVMTNQKISENNRLKKVIFFIPRQIWHLYLFIFKGLTSF